jgi:hypothetical protein
MIDTKLIIFEGIPGSGKTTTSQLLHKYFAGHRIDSNVFIEGSKHPIDLPFFAYLSLNEYDTLFLKYKGQAEWLEENSVVEDNYVLVPYKMSGQYPQDDKLVEYLRSKEFCYSNKPIVSFDIFKEVFFRRFEQFVNKNEITIFESVLFQHQIHDINRLYPYIEDIEIVEYIRTIATILMPLNPILFYISQDNVKESLIHTALLRSKPKWSTEEVIAYYEKRKTLEMKAINMMPFQSIILNNNNYTWDEMFNTILSALSIVTK